MIGPFIFFDHIGPFVLPPGIPRQADVRPHPHINLATVTYLFAGEITHRDSLGFHQDIRPGEVNWMTAGRGITHSERFDRMRVTGGPMHGVQAWVALPAEQEECDPAFVHHGAEDLPLYEAPGIRARLIAGSAFFATSPVLGHSPMFYVHTELDEGGQTSVPGGYSERAVFVAAGAVTVDGQEYGAGKMLVIEKGAAPVVTAAPKATLLMIGGEPLGERHIYWNFVSSRKERIEQAKADWKAGRFALPPDDKDEFIPLPDEPKPAEPMS
jgi:redox-sensitive bicupin YhaK (pirin superfamily)